MVRIYPVLQFIFFSCVFGSATLDGLQIHDYAAMRHDRFVAGGYPANPVANDGLWVSSGSFSGVGWSANDPRKGLALISPRHFVGANHFRPPLGSEIEFLALDGTLRSYTYSRFYNIENTDGENTDIFIGELSGDIPASHNVPLYPLLDLREAELIGRDIFVYGRGSDGPRVGRGIIGAFSDSFGGGPLGSLNDTRNYSFEYVARSAGQDDAYAETGDSGSPSFIRFDGYLTVSGIHSAIMETDFPVTGKTTTTYDSFLLAYRDQIDEHLAKTGHRLTVTPVGDTSLGITAIEHSGDSVTLTIHNPSGLPYDLQRSADLVSWETAATSESTGTWTGAVPAGTGQLFWRLVQFPVAKE